MEPRPDFYHIVKKGSSSRGAPGEPRFATARFYAQTCRYIHVSCAVPGSGSAVIRPRRYTIALATPQPDERQEVPPTRLSGRRPRSAGRPRRPRGRRPNPAPRRCSANLPGWPPKHQMPGYREVVRCAQCGNVGSGDIGLDSRCPGAARTCTRARSARPSIRAAASSACSRSRCG